MIECDECNAGFWVDVSRGGEEYELHGTRYCYFCGSEMENE